MRNGKLVWDNDMVKKVTAANEQLEQSKKTVDPSQESLPEAQAKKRRADDGPEIDQAQKKPKRQKDSTVKEPLFGPTVTKTLPKSPSTKKATTSKQSQSQLANGSKKAQSAVEKKSLKKKATQTVETETGKGDQKSGSDKNEETDEENEEGTAQYTWRDSRSRTDLKHGRFVFFIWLSIQ